MNEVQKLKFYQKGTLTVGNRLVDEDKRNVQASLDRSNSLTSGHRACQGCGVVACKAFFVHVNLLNQNTLPTT